MSSIMVEHGRARHDVALHQSVMYIGQSVRQIYSFCLRRWLVVELLNWNPLAIFQMQIICPSNRSLVCCVMTSVRWLVMTDWRPCSLCHLTRRRPSMALLLCTLSCPNGWYSNRLMTHKTSSFALVISQTVPSHLSFWAFQFPRTFDHSKGILLS